MKKIRNLGIIFAGLLLTLSACGADAHTHTFSSDWSKDAEYHWHAATCEHTEEVSEKAKHTWNEGRVVTPATCHSVGVKEFACTVCGQTKQENIPMLDHSWESGWSKDATYHWKKCTSEGCNEIAQKAEHTWDAGTNIRPADCHNKALTRYTCTVCGQIKEVEGALGDHVWESGYHHDATHHWKECTVDGCGETTVKEAHEWGTGSITTNPTYTTDGVLTYTCVCGETKTEVIHKLEENAKPSALAQKDDYALETFGDPENKVLAYAAADVAYNDDLQSYAWKYEVEGSQEKWLNYPTSYLSAGLFFLEFDYYVVQAGSGYFYLELWCNDTQADNVTFRVENMAVGTKLHARYDVNFTGKTVTKGMIKVHSYQGAGQYEFYLDNVKLIKRADLAYDEPLVLASVDGGKFGYKYSEELGAEAYNFVSNGAIAYEKFYLRGKEAVPAAKYEFSFDYAFSRFETNEMWITIYEKTNGSPVLETRISNTTVEQKHSQTHINNTSNVRGHNSNNV